MSQEDRYTSQKDINLSEGDDIVVLLKMPKEEGPVYSCDEVVEEEGPVCSRDGVVEEEGPVYSHDGVFEEEGPVYSRDEVVEEVTKLYDLLIGLHIREEDVLYPPDDGWPEIDSETMAWMGKDDTVIDLMRHLPYICRDGNWEAYEIFTMTSPVEYRGPDMNLRYGIEYEYPRPPPYIFTFASQTCRDGCYILINTRRGTVTLYDPMYGKDTSTLGQPTIENEPAEEGKEEDEEWRDHSTWRIPEFFQIMKEKFRSLELLPEGKFQVRPNSNNEHPVAKIFRNYGWPEAIEEQEQCLEKVEEYVDAVFDRVCMEQQMERLQISDTP